MLRKLKDLYGPTPAGEFGPLALRAVRQRMIEADWSRTHINRQVGRLKAVFKWAVGQEMIPPAVYHSLIAVTGLRWGKTPARESRPVRPVAQPFIDAVLPRVAPQVAAIMEMIYARMRIKRLVT